MTESGLRRPVLLNAEHETERFDCGVTSLNDFLRRYALVNQVGGGSRTYVATRDERVVAYYSLAPASVSTEGATPRARAGQGRCDIPTILIGRLAVDLAEQGGRLGSHMLLDALLRAHEGAQVIGGRAILVHAIDEQARAFYLHHEFEPSPTDEMHLMMLMKDVRRTLGL